MNVEIICALITTLGVVASAVISYYVSRDSATKEIEKMQLNWSREDSAASDEEFSEMIVALTRYIHSRKKEDEIPALEKLNDVRRKETGNTYFKLDLLYRLMAIKDEAGDPDFILLDKYLSEVIDQSREDKRKAQAGH